MKRTPSTPHPTRSVGHLIVATLLALLGCWSLLLTPLQSPVVVVEATLWVGSSGSGLYFSREHCDILGLDWQHLNMPVSEVTIEFWVNIVDTFNKDHAVLGYTEFDASQTPFYMNPDAAEIRLSHTHSRFYRGNDDNCNSPNCLLFHKGWQHWAVTWSALNGEVITYVNGALERNSSLYGTPRFDSLLTRHGSMLLGQEPDDYAGGFDENQAFDGMIDEFRMWNVIRTPAQIAANYLHTLSHLTQPQMASQGLALYYNFDDAATVNSGLVADMTGTGNTGLMGLLINNEQLCTYDSGRPSQAPTAPKSVAALTSLTKVVGDAPIQVFVAPTLAAPDTNVTLLALTDVPSATLSYQLTSLPTKGTIKNSVTGAAIAINTPFTNNQLIYSYDAAHNPTSFTSQQVIDSFTYSATDGIDTGSNTVNILAYAISTPKNLTYQTDELTGLGVNLGTILEDGQQALVIISQLPQPIPSNPLVTGAALYLATFTKAASVAEHTDLNTDLTGRTPITVGTQLDNSIGLGFFQPPTIANVLPNLPQAVYVQFAYQYKHPISGVLSAPAYVTVYVTPVDIAPTAIPATLTLSLATAAHSSADNSSYGVIALTATDPDGSFSPIVYQRVTVLPKLGYLYQVDESGVIIMGTETAPVAPMTVAARTNLPVVSSFATAVLNVSSQYNANGCAPNCVNFIGCDFSQCANDYMAPNILGPPDCYPVAGDCTGSFEPYTKNDGAGGGGTEWIEISIQNPVYVSQVEIFETTNPGQVVRIYISDVYTNSATTPWRLIYSGEPDISLGAIARIFTPSVCNMPSFAAKYLKIVFRTDVFVSQWTGLDAVRVSGTLVPPPGRLTNSQNKVAYVPFPGIYNSHNSSAVFDTFSFRPNDCEKEATTDTTVQVYLTLDGTSTGTSGNPVPSSFAALRTSPGFVETTTEVSVDEDTSSTIVPLQLTDILTSYNTAFGTSLTTAALSVVVVDIAPSTGVTLTKDTPEVDLYDTTTNNIICSSTVASTTHCTPTTLSALKVGVQVNRQSVAAASTTYVASMYVTVNGQYSYLYKINLPISQSLAPKIWTSTDNLAYTVAISVVGGITILYAAIMGALVYTYRGRPVFRAASPRFCGMILFGAALGGLYCIVDSQYVPTAASCIAEIWIGHFAYALAFSVLFFRTYRVNQIFRQKKMQVIKLTDEVLMLRAGIVLACVSVYLIVWSAAGSPQPKLLLVDNTIYTVCMSTSSAWSNVLIALEGGVLAWGAILCFQQRNFPDIFNDSQTMAIVIYNTSVLGALAVGISKGLLTTATSVSLFQQVAWLICLNVLISVLFIPKLIMIHSNLVDNKFDLQSQTYATNNTDGSINNVKSISDDSNTNTEKRLQINVSGPKSLRSNTSISPVAASNGPSIHETDILAPKRSVTLARMSGGAPPSGTGGYSSQNGSQGPSLMDPPPYGNAPISPVAIISPTPIEVDTATPLPNQPSDEPQQTNQQ